MPEELHKGAKGNIFNFVRNLRKDETDAEKILWRHLKNRKTFDYSALYTSPSPSGEGRGEVSTEGIKPLAGSKIKS